MIIRGFAILAVIAVGVIICKCRQSNAGAQLLTINIIVTAMAIQDIPLTPSAPVLPSDKPLQRGGFFSSMRKEKKKQKVQEDEEAPPSYTDARFSNGQFPRLTGLGDKMEE